MAPRKQNPIKDISDTVSAWLGGNRGTVNPQVQRTISQTKELGKVVDQFATGGMGRALVADAQRMAATGSSTPSALYKTAAVNLAAGAVGAAAAKVAGKAISTIGPKVGRQVGVHLSDVPNLRKITYSSKRAGSGLGRQTVEGQTYKFSSQVGTQTEPPFTPAELADYVAGERAHLAKVSGRPEKVVGYITKSRPGKIDPAYGPWSTARMVPSQRVVDRVELPAGSKGLAASRLNEALVKYERTVAANQRAATTTVGVVSGVGARQVLSDKTKKNKKSKKPQITEK